MIAKISSPSRLAAALGYNFKKVEKHEASVLLVQGLFHDQNGAYSRAQVLKEDGLPLLAQSAPGRKAVRQGPFANCP